MITSENVVGRHGVNYHVASRGIGVSDFEQVACQVGADEHHHVVNFEGANRISVGMQHVVVRDPVFAGAPENDRIIVHQYNLIAVMRYVSKVVADLD